MEGTGLTQSASEEGQEGEVAGKKEDQKRAKGEAEKNKQEGEEEAAQEDKGENLPALVLPEEYGEDRLFHIYSLSASRLCLMERKNVDLISLGEIFPGLCGWQTSVYIFLGPCLCGRKTHK